jgi:hypothetical protein
VYDGSVVHLDERLALAKLVHCGHALLPRLFQGIERSTRFLPKLFMSRNGHHTS